jgi:hypothetical protein
MIKLVSTSLVAAAMGLGLTLAAGSASAGEPPPPPKKEPAACSPGFYKQNLEKWCPEGSISACPSTGLPLPGLCADFVPLLSAEEPFKSPKEVRDAALTILNACFGTAEASPCEED